MDPPLEVIPPEHAEPPRPFPDHARDMPLLPARMVQLRRCRLSASGPGLGRGQDPERLHPAAAELEGPSASPRWDSTCTEASITSRAMVGPLSPST